MAITITGFIYIYLHFQRPPSPPFLHALANCKFKSICQKIWTPFPHSVTVEFDHRRRDKVFDIRMDVKTRSKFWGRAWRHRQL